MYEHALYGRNVLIQLARDTYAAFVADGGRALSAGLVYYSTLSTVPLLIMVFALPGLLLRIVDQQTGQQLMRVVEALFGSAISTILADTLVRVQSQSQVMAGVSLVMLLYSASSGFRFLRYAFRRIWREEQLDPEEPRRVRLRKTLLGRTVDYLIAFGIVLAAPLVVLCGLLLFSLALFARTLLHTLPVVGGALGSLLTPLSLLGVYAGIYILLLWIMPPVRLRWREIGLPGLACAVAVLITTYALGLYIRFFSGSSLYGAIGTLFAIQIWTYANATVLFTCAELCKLLVQLFGSLQPVETMDN